MLETVLTLLLFLAVISGAFMILAFFEGVILDLIKWAKKRDAERRTCLCKKCNAEIK